MATRTLCSLTLNETKTKTKRKRLKQLESNAVIHFVQLALATVILVYMCSSVSFQLFRLHLKEPKQNLITSNLASQMHEYECKCDTQNAKD